MALKLNISMLVLLGWTTQSDQWNREGGGHILGHSFFPGPKQRSPSEGMFIILIITSRLGLTGVKCEALPRT